MNTGPEHTSDVPNDVSLGGSLIKYVVAICGGFTLFPWTELRIAGANLHGSKVEFTI